MGGRGVEKGGNRGRGEGKIEYCVFLLVWFYT